jgi:hypothetical protein
LDRPPALPAAPGTRRDSLGAFLVAGATWVADNPQTSQRLLKRVLSHFAYGESLAVRTRMSTDVLAGYIREAELFQQHASVGMYRGRDGGTALARLG